MTGEHPKEKSSTDLNPPFLKGAGGFILPRFFYKVLKISLADVAFYLKPAY